MSSHQYKSQHIKRHHDFFSEECFIDDFTKHKNQNRVKEILETIHNDFELSIYINDADFECILDILDYFAAYFDDWNRYKSDLVFRSLNSKAISVLHDNYVPFRQLVVFYHMLIQKNENYNSFIFELPFIVFSLMNSENERFIDHPIESFHNISMLCFHLLIEFVINDFFVDWNGLIEVINVFMSHICFPNIEIQRASLMALAISLTKYPKELSSIVLSHRSINIVFSFLSYEYNHELQNLSMSVFSSISSQNDDRLILALLENGLLSIDLFQNRDAQFILYSLQLIRNSLCGGEMILDYFLNPEFVISFIHLLGDTAFLIKKSVIKTLAYFMRFPKMSQFFQENPQVIDDILDNMQFLSQKMQRFVQFSIDGINCR